MTFRKNYVFTGLALLLCITWGSGLIMRYYSGESVSPIYMIAAGAAALLFVRLAFVPFAVLKERVVVLNPGLFVSRIVAYHDIKNIKRQSDTNIVIELNNADPIAFKEMLINKKDRDRFAREIMQRVASA